VKEYKLALFFEENNIKYEYERPYPKSQYKSDFYLPNKDLYVEYYGMLENKKYNNLNEIQTQYKNKMELKNLYCEKNNLQLVYNTNFDKLIEKLKNILCK
jgi:DNA helicase-4